MPTSPIAIIFDMDGVLINSEPCWQAAEIRVLGELGVPLNAAMTQATTGWRIDRVVEFWRLRFPFEGDTPVIAHAITAEVARQVRLHGIPIPGATELVQACHADGLAVGLATSSAGLLIEAVLERLALRPFFHALASASEVPSGKPDPAVYRLCAKRLGVPSECCVAVEDSCSGIRSAVAAGMRCLAVFEKHTPKAAAMEAGAHGWVQSLQTINPTALRVMLNPASR